MSNGIWQKTSSLVEEGTEFAEETISEQNGTGNSRANRKTGTGNKDENSQIGTEEKAAGCEELRENDQEILQVRRNASNV